MDTPETSYLHAQKTAMKLINDWANDKKVPMPKKELFKGLVMADISESTARKSMAALVRKGYLRRAVGSSNQTSYVMLRTFNGVSL